ncbi:MAG: cell division topological specificity factor MinE [Thermodesulfobacteriota bacterium]|nr:cell division topological specificity factor MinE [Thermodesulfobacteriota bacterium]
MSFIDFFRSSKQSSASIAKERLQIIVARERRQANSPDFLPQMQQDILQVVRKYIHIEEEDMKLTVDNSGDYEVLELNIALSENGDKG